MSLFSFSNTKKGLTTDFTVGEMGGKFPDKSKKKSFVNGFKEHVDQPLLRITE